MQKRSRRPHGLNARKISISVSEEDLRVLSRRARRAHGGNVSAVIHELTATLRRQEAADRLLDLLGGESVTQSEMDAIRAEISGPGRRRRKVA
ncbi:MAG: hypothetical protein IPM35_36170 [Myxococcales bacterium]|nr:hypothetical protein [Myxococcales bacterium]